MKSAASVSDIKISPHLSRRRVHTPKVSVNLTFLLLELISKSVIQSYWGRYESGVDRYEQDRLYLCDAMRCDAMRCDASGIAALIFVGNLKLKTYGE